MPPLSLRGPAVTIRTFSRVPFSATDLVGGGTMGRRMLAFLAACVRGRANVIVSGGAGSGKTTLLGVLSSFIPDGERLITIEDAAELRLAKPHVVALEARPANVEGKDRSRSVTSCATRCACGPIASSSGRSAAARRSTCCRP